MAKRERSKRLETGDRRRPRRDGSNERGEREGTVVYGPATGAARKRRETSGNGVEACGLSWPTRGQFQPRRSIVKLAISRTKRPTTTRDANTSSRTSFVEPIGSNTDGSACSVNFRRCSLPIARFPFGSQVSGPSVLRVLSFAS